MHGSNVVIAANNTPRRVDEIVQIVGQIEEQTSTVGARPLAEELRALTEALLEGPEAGVEGSKDEHGLRAGRAPPHAPQEGGRSPPG